MEKLRKKVQRDVLHPFAPPQQSNLRTPSHTHTHFLRVEEPPSTFKYTATATLRCCRSSSNSVVPLLLLPLPIYFVKLLLPLKHCEKESAIVKRNATESAGERETQNSTSFSTAQRLLLPIEKYRTVAYTEKRSGTPQQSSH